MTTREAFLADVIENPDDDAPRLVFADWLDDNGQSERAEFIRLQCRLVALPEDDPACDDLEARQRELLAAHERAWVGEMPAEVCGWRFRCGWAIG